jgi:hypothetical protein
VKYGRWVTGDIQRTLETRRTVAYPEYCVTKAGKKSIYI